MFLLYRREKKVSITNTCGISDDFFQNSSPTLLQLLKNPKTFIPAFMHLFHQFCPPLEQKIQFIKVLILSKLTILLLLIL